MIKMFMSNFTKNEEFPFYIQFGMHKERLYMHSHADFLELVIVMEGSAKHTVNDESYQIKKGDVFIISNHIKHGYCDTQNFQICNIMFKPDFWTKNSYDIVKSEGFRTLFVIEPNYTKSNHFLSRLKLNLEDFMKTCEICNTLFMEYTVKSEGWKTAFTAEFLKLAVILSRLYSAEQAFEENASLNLAKAAAFIETHFTENILISELAALSNYSERQFIRVFQKEYNCRPTEYISNLKINMACRLLETTSRSITEIALSCGYDDSNYFSRVFKKHIGITPTKYRKVTDENYPHTMVNT